MEKQIAGALAPILLADPLKCNGCRWCEIVCSLWQEGISQPDLSRIQVLRGAEGGFVPVFCQQCVDAPCCKVCPAEAISRDHRTGVVAVDYQKCVSCRLCVYACPYGAMGFDTERSRVFKCDLCGGDPQCVAVCAAGALFFEDSKELQTRRMTAAADRLLTAMGRQCKIR